MNVHAILDWIKSNIIIVVCVLVIIAAPIGLSWYTSKMNGDVRKEVGDRAKLKDDLLALEKTQIEAGSGVVNQRLLDRYRDVVQANRVDADHVVARAIEHNRRGRGVLMPVLFPNPPFEQRETLPLEFHDRLMEAYAELLTSVRAGAPPSAEEMLPELNRRQEQFMAEVLAKNAVADLMPQERALLEEQLTNLRLGRYVEAAENIGMYASVDDLDLPQWNQTQLPTMEQMWDWQCRYWTDEDILTALSDANRDAPSVIQSPVKRVISLRSERMGEVADGASSSGAGGGGGARGGSGRRSPGGQGGSGAAAAETSAGVKVNPSKPAPVNYGASFTGRVSNPLYDVRLVELVLIVETARVPEVLNALAARNFITLLDVKMSEAKPLTAVRQGYYYGNEPMSEVKLTLETIWLREWTSEFMPEEVKMALGVPLGNEKPTG